ncbi:class I SAM-dependent methyltransferase [Caldichromatium japonicum]|uniref:Class I SAM-dependent methyltransferase n=1 Tax=Caldichromatium japonicum TaxID=2699430 RepID=A0A6G7VA59_9GAMM|nr:class I SAM-dependent methyltransferase [Caldichromatium japonicum]QIK36949.1 class I SAM-dependent methyltransferase [Caldichromatium japonicum]
MDLLLQHKIGTLMMAPMILRHLSGFRIASHLTISERALLYHLAASVSPGPILEIGSYLGASAYFLAAGRLSSGRSGQVLCVDTWNNDAMSEGRRDTYAKFMANTRRFSGYIVPIRGFSHAVVDQVRRLAPNGLAMLFVDGDHSWEGSKRDWDAYRGLLQPGAVMAFHDIGWAEGVQRIVRDEVEPLVNESGSLPNLWWGRLAR